jgi:hypothetical protein
LQSAQQLSWRHLPKAKQIPYANAYLVLTKLCNRWNAPNR